MTFKDFMKKLVPKIGKEDQPNEDKETKQVDQGEKCALCQGENPDKKWMGQMWHSNCFRKAKKMAKKMI